MIMIGDPSVLMSLLTQKLWHVELAPVWISHRTDLSVLGVALLRGFSNLSETYTEFSQSWRRDLPVCHFLY